MRSELFKRRNYVFLALVASACLVVLLLALSHVAHASHVGIEGKELLFTGQVSPDYVVDGPITFGEGQELLRTTLIQSTSDVSVVVFASYTDEANNGVNMLMGVSGSGRCSQPLGSPIAARGVVILVSEYPSDVEFPNAHDFVEGNPLYNFGVVKCTSTGDDYRSIQLRRPDHREEFTVEFEVYGVVE